MKKIFVKTGLLFFILFLITDCTQKKDFELDEARTENLKNHLDCMGFSADGATMLDENNVLVEGDIILDADMVLHPENYATPAPGNAEDRQYATPAATGVISAANFGNINYWIDPAVPAAWVTAINLATADWTAITDCGITFTQVGLLPAVGQQVLIFTTSTSLTAAVVARVPAACRTFPEAGVFARARFPSGGMVGQAVIINLASNPTPNAAGQRTIMRHEIGHSLGNRHADAVANGEGTTACGV